MRNPDRIDEMLKLISEIWHKNPDLRLCQLIGNCFTQGGFRTQKDIYYVEDDELQNRFEKKYL
jgi:uncharacterized protein YihD (DUF1040 family)